MDLCKSGAAVDIKVPAESGEVSIRTRLLARRPGTIVLEHPWLDARPFPVKPGTTLVLRCPLPTGVVEAALIVRESRVQPNLGGRGELVLEAPASFRSAQRRAASRVQPVVTQQTATLFMEGGTVSGFNAEIVDLSDTGCCLLLNDSDAGPLRKQARITLRMALPDDPATVLELAARIVRTAAAAHQQVRVGVQFVFEETVAADPRGQLSSYVAREQQRISRLRAV